MALFNELMKDAIETLTPIEIVFNDQTIKIKQQISTDDVYNIVTITLQQCMEGGIFNSLLAEVYFKLNVVYKYTDIIFAEEDRLNSLKTYDKLSESGLLDIILENISKSDIDAMKNIITSTGLNIMKYGNTIINFLKSYIDTMPQNAAMAQELINNFNPEKFQEVIQFAKAANGDRPVPKE